jgi:hypothetical protein
VRVKPSPGILLKILKAVTHLALGGLQILDGLVVRSCTSHPGVLGSIPKREKPAHDWMISVLGPLFRTAAGQTVRKGSRPAQANGAATWRSATTYETKRAAGAWSSTSASPMTVMGDDDDASSHPLQNGDTPAGHRRASAYCCAAQDQ